MTSVICLHDRFGNSASREVDVLNPVTLVYTILWSYNVHIKLEK